MNIIQKFKLYKVVKLDFCHWLGSGFPPQEETFWGVSNWVHFSSLQSHLLLGSLHGCTGYHKLQRGTVVCRLACPTFSQTFKWDISRLVLWLLVSGFFCCASIEKKPFPSHQLSLSTQVKKLVPEKKRRPNKYWETTLCWIHCKHPTRREYQGLIPFVALC